MLLTHNVPMKILTVVIVFPEGVPLFVKIVQPNYKHCRKRRCEENAAAADAAAAKAEADAVYNSIPAKKDRMIPRAQQIYNSRNHSYGESMAIYRDYQAHLLGSNLNDPNNDETLMDWFSDQTLQSIINGSYFPDYDGPLR